MDGWAGRSFGATGVLEKGQPKEHSPEPRSERRTAARTGDMVEPAMWVAGKEGGLGVRKRRLTKIISYNYFLQVRYEYYKFFKLIKRISVSYFFCTE